MVQPAFSNSKNYAVDFSPYSAVDKDSANIRKEEEIQKKTQ
jgi:hypothetical protein